MAINILLNVLFVYIYTVCINSEGWVRVVCPYLDEVHTEASIENFLSDYSRLRIENVREYVEH